MNQFQKKHVLAGITLNWRTGYLLTVIVCGGTFPSTTWAASATVPAPKAATSDDPNCTNPIPPPATTLCTQKFDNKAPDKVLKMHQQISTSDMSGDVKNAVLESKTALTKTYNAFLDAQTKLCAEKSVLASQITVSAPTGTCNYASIIQAYNNTGNVSQAYAQNVDSQWQQISQTYLMEAFRKKNMADQILTAYVQKNNKYIQVLSPWETEAYNAAQSGSRTPPKKNGLFTPVVDAIRQDFSAYSAFSTAMKVKSSCYEALQLKCNTP